jgi:hypothetical protein
MMTKRRSREKTGGYRRSGQVVIVAPARSWEVDLRAAGRDHRRRTENTISTRGMVALDGGRRDVHNHHAHPRGGRI